MESTLIQNNAERKQSLEHWIVNTCHINVLEIHDLPNDASLRRYFRIMTPSKSIIAMDAPPSQENCEAYVVIAKQLREMGLIAPEILEMDLKNGFLLITDFGDDTYLKKLNDQNADHLYSVALDALSLLQTCQSIPNKTLSLFDRDWMWREWNWHKEWFLDKLLGIKIKAFENQLDKNFERIVNAAISQPQVFIHRDYHSANLMVLENNQVGILDFQDAFIGPITYDLVSLLRDCYIAWPKERVVHWVKTYWQSSPNISKKFSSDEFLHWFDWMGIERHLKALFTFARKQLRDQQPKYLRHVPRTLNYLLSVSENYSELKELHHLYSTLVFEKAESLCAQ